MAFPQQLSDLQQEVYTLLAEANNTTIADLRSGTGAAATIATSANVTLFLNEAAENMCRTFYALRDTGTYASLPSGTRFVQFSNSNFTMGSATSYKLWAARAVTWNAIQIPSCSASAIESHYPSWITDANAQPTYWYPQGKDGVGLYPATTGIQTLTINGLALPTRLVNSTDTTPFNADENKAIVWQAVARIAMMNVQDPSVRDRGALWWKMWTDYANERLLQVYSADPSLAELHFPKPGNVGAMPQDHGSEQSVG